MIADTEMFGVGKSERVETQIKDLTEKTERKKIEVSTNVGIEERESGKGG